MVEEDPIGVVLDLHRQKVRDRPENLEFVRGVELLELLGDDLLRRGGDQPVVDVDGDDNQRRLHRLDEDAYVGSRATVPETSHERLESAVPLTRGLLGAVHGAIELEDEAGAERVRVALRSANEHIFSHTSVQECGVEVEVCEREILRSGEGDDVADRRRASYRGKRLVDVYAGALCEALRDESSLEAPSPVEVGLDREDPSRSERFGADGELGG